MKNNSFLPLYVTNFFGTLNDNFLKTLACLTVIGWIADERVRSLLTSVVAGMLVLPYILCSPLADRLTAVWPKRRIVRAAKWAELPIMAVAIAGFALHSPWFVIGAVLLMGLQSSLYSPAKYALVRDIGGAERISTGMGGMEGVSFLGVLMGTVVGAIVADRAGMVTKYVLLVCFASLGLLASYTIRAKEELNRSLHAINPVRYIARAYRMAGRYDGLNAVIFMVGRGDAPDGASRLWQGRGGAKLERHRHGSAPLRRGGWHCRGADRRGICRQAALSSRRDASHGLDRRGASWRSLLRGAFAAVVWRCAGAFGV